MTGFNDPAKLDDDWMVAKRSGRVVLGAVVDEIPDAKVLAIMELHATHDVAGRRAYADFCTRLKALAKELGYRVLAHVKIDNEKHAKWLRAWGMAPTHYIMELN